MSRVTIEWSLLALVHLAAVAVNPLAAQTSLGYRVQAIAAVDSAFSLAEARRLRQRLGGPCEVYIIRSDSLGVLRIQVGGFDGVSEAQEAQDALVGLGYRDAFIVLPAELGDRIPIASEVECVWWIPGEGRDRPAFWWPLWPLPIELLPPSIQLLTLPHGFPSLRVRRVDSSGGGRVEEPALPSNQPDA